MALQSTGSITLNDIHIEAGGTSATEASINDTDILGLIGAGIETEVEFSDWYGASMPISYIGAVSTVQGSAGSPAYISLTSLNLQQGDLVIVAAAQDGPGDTYTNGYTTSGWTAQTPVTYNTATEPGFSSYHKFMGPTPDTSFGWSLGFYNFGIPMVAVAFRNASSRTAQQSASVSYPATSINIPSRNVANSGSLSVITTSRGGNNAFDSGTNILNTPSGWTKAKHEASSNAGIGYNWKQSVDVYYRLNCPTGTLNPGSHGWYFYGDANTNHSIFY